MRRSLSSAALLSIIGTHRPPSPPRARRERSRRAGSGVDPSARSPC